MTEFSSLLVSLVRGARDGAKEDLGPYPYVCREFQKLREFSEAMMPHRSRVTYPIVVAY